MPTGTPHHLLLPRHCQHGRSMTASTAWNGRLCGICGGVRAPRPTNDFRHCQQTGRCIRRDSRIRKAAEPPTAALQPSAPTPNRAAAVGFCAGLEEKASGKAVLALPDVLLLLSVTSHFAMPRYRKVTIWPLVQVSSGEKVVALVPLVTPASTAQSTAS